MTIQREMFIKEYRIAKENGNIGFMEWLSDLMWRAEDEEMIINE